MQAEPDVNKLLDAIQSGDAKVRTEAWLSAGDYQAAAVRPLASLWATMENQLQQLLQQRADKKAIEHPLEVGRAAKRAMWKIVRTVGAPGASGKAATLQELLQLLAVDQPLSVRREALWMISEIGDGQQVVEAVAQLLQDEQLREDARMVLERIPGDESVAALTEVLETVPHGFRLNIAQSLRNRGVDVDNSRYPSQKMVPTRKTQVKPVDVTGPA